MLKPILMGILSTVVSAPALAQQCLHGPNETAAERARRQQAIQVARQINALEAATLGPGPQAPRYKRPSELKLPPMPDDFELSFHMSGRTYTFSLKDSRDPCYFAIFSDHDGLVYATSPEPEVATVIPLATKEKEGRSDASGVSVTGSAGNAHRVARRPRDPLRRRQR